MDKLDLKTRLQNCSSREAIEEVFHNSGISGLKDKKATLDNIMGNPETFYSAQLSEEDQYQREVSIFLTGAWKINEFYERAGL
ncbi:hypothetical protein P0082_00965 [Candidatus Haliotispira prima]|uniref:Uncharacterized protein n=1 Tax=Candidatus Haliotispira prima TaxID=3034016 RepID=A0ABY8MKX8_9SPIO|nr:hypothetical protein P0082_00965 [Candidatus Haliotispira prima]